MPLLTDITGTVLTPTLATAEFVDRQPAALVPVTVYVAFVLGLTTNAPQLMVYVLAPVGVMV